MMPDLESLVGERYEPPFGCFHLVRKALALRGFDVPDYCEGLRECERIEALRAGLAAHAVPVRDPQRGDVILLQVLGGPGHIGIMLDERRMLHSMDKVDAAIERIDSARWRGRVLGFYRC